MFIVIPACLYNPCKHGGSCKEIRVTNFECNCTGTHYKGGNCDIGVIEVPPIPILMVDQVSNLTISAQPDTELIVQITSSSDYLIVTPSLFYHYSEFPQLSFTLLAKEKGVYSLTFTLFGTDSEMFEEPETVQVLALYSSDAVPPYISDPITPGCCTPGGGQTYQCPSSTSSITVPSTCQWETDSSGGHTTTGVVFVNSPHLSLPISISGLYLSGANLDELVISLPHQNVPCTGCGSNCSNYNVSATDTLRHILSRSLGRAFLSVIVDLIPEWLSFDIYQLNTSNIHVSQNDFLLKVLNGNAVDLIDGCEELELYSEGFYAIYRHHGKFSVSVDQQKLTYTPDTGDKPICFAIDLCRDTSPVHITIPKEVQVVLQDMTIVQVQYKF